MLYLRHSFNMVTFMPCMASNSGYVNTFYLSSSGSSISYTGTLTATTAHISATTAMFSNYIKIQSGTINADKIFIQDDATIKFGENVKITGDVYLLPKKDFDSIWWTWSNSEMNKYIDQHSLKPIHYENESYDSHFNELVSVHDAYITENAAH